MRVPWNIRKQRMKTIDYKRTLSRRKRMKSKFRTFRNTSEAPAYVTASMTLEATLVFPIFLLALLYFIFFFQVLMMEMQIEQAMQYTSRTMAIYAGVECIPDGVSQEANDLRAAVTKAGTTLASKAVAKTIMESRLKKRGVQTGRIQNGLRGISYSKSRFDGDYIDLIVSYKMKEPFSCFPKISTIPIQQRVRARKWTGDHGVMKEEQETMVYITPNGSVYHRSADCTYLNRSIQTVHITTIGGKRNQSGGKYYACSRCAKNGTSMVCYITDYGERYHFSRSCTELSRDIQQIPLSQVGVRCPCSKCGEQ